MSVFTSRGEMRGATHSHSKHAGAEQTTVKSEAGETRERVITMMNGKVDFQELGRIEEQKPVALGENI